MIKTNKAGVIVKVPAYRSRRYVFTLNNYNEPMVNKMVNTFEALGAKYIFGKEVGAQGTPHLQGYVNFGKLKACSLMTKIMPKAHYEKAKGNELQNIEYCSKDGDHVGNLKPIVRLKDVLLKEYETVEWKEWQRELLDALVEEPNSRTIHWIEDSVGNIGKSFLAKYLYLKHDAIIANGKGADVFNQVKTWMENNPEKSPRIVILDVPRHCLDYINYGALEMIKNGLMYSGKYEGGVCAFASPHLIVFANKSPDFEKFSDDRWAYKKI